MQAETMASHRETSGAAPKGSGSALLDVSLLAEAHSHADERACVTPCRA